MGNKWTIAKDIQKDFYRKYDLVITRAQALEIMSAMKDGVAMYNLKGEYVSTRSNDDITRATIKGVKVGAYGTFYTTREWNNSVAKGEWGDVKNNYATLWDHNLFPLEGEIGSKNV